jgi:putative DNA primase/helicase
MSLFRGFVQTKGKRCIEKFKDVEDLMTYSDARHLDEYAAVLDKDTILLDFDNEEEGERAFKLVQDKALRCRVYKTDRGYHMFFRNKIVNKTSTATRLACGLRADIKIGPNQYSIMKLKGVERQMIYDTETYEELPKFFVPVISTIELFNLGEGDGRNQKLFSYILPLQNAGLSKSETKECIKVINEYVFKTPLPSKELSTVLREESFAKPSFFDGKKFLFNKFAEYLRANAYIIKIDGNLHIYRDGVYERSDDYIENEMIKHIPQLSDTMRKEVLKYLQVLIDTNTPQAPEHMVCFRNGVYDVIRDEILPFSDRLVFTNKVEWDYNPEAYSEVVDKTLDKIACNDPAIRSLLEEVVGYCFYGRNELGKAFILVGDGSEKGSSNGKSTFLDMVRTMLGEKNIVSLDLADLDKNFYNAELFGKMANIGDDIADGYIPNSAMFKKFVTGESAQVAFKYGKPFMFNCRAKFLFSANEIPRIKDSGGAIQRRLIIIPFLAHFSKNDPDYRPYIKYELREKDAIEYLIQLGIAGLKRVLENNAFTESEKVDEQLHEFAVNNNPTIEFFVENPDLEIENQSNTAVYQKYLEYCITNGYKGVSKVKFSRMVNQHFGFVMKSARIDGKCCRVYARPE